MLGSILINSFYIHILIMLLKEQHKQIREVIDGRLIARMTLDSGIQ